MRVSQFCFNPKYLAIPCTNHLSSVPELNAFMTCIAFSHNDSGSELLKGNERDAHVFASVLKPTDTNFATRLF